MSTSPAPEPASLSAASSLIETATALGAAVPAPSGTTAWVVSIPPFASPGPGSVLGVFASYQEALSAIAAHALADWERRDNRVQGWIELRPWFSHDEFEAFHTSMSAEERLETLDRFAERKAKWLQTASEKDIADGWYRTLALSGTATDHRAWVSEHRINNQGDFLGPL